MKKLKNISVSLLFIGALMMLGHSIIPHHHHHTGSILSHKENHCPADEDEHEKKDATPFHCHAFNDTNLYQKYLNSKDFAKIALQFLRICAPKINLTLTVAKTLKFPGINVIVHNVFVNASITPRAPPQLF